MKHVTLEYNKEGVKFVGENEWFQHRVDVMFWENPEKNFPAMSPHDFMEEHEDFVALKALELVYLNTGKEYGLEWFLKEDSLLEVYKVSYLAQKLFVRIQEGTSDLEEVFAYLQNGFETLEDGIDKTKVLKELASLLVARDIILTRDYFQYDEKMIMDAVYSSMKFVYEEADAVFTGFIEVEGELDFVDYLREFKNLEKLLFFNLEKMK